MIGNTVSGYTFKRTDQVKTLASKSVIQYGEDKIQVNPLHLFNRLVKISSDLKSDMKCEVTPHPSALFDDCGMMRRGSKSTILKDYLFTPNKPSVPDINICHVIDGGSLVQRLQWDNGKSFGDICKTYVSYVHNNYMNPVVVFDGYDTPSTKDHAHVIRQEGAADTTAFINEDMIFTTKKTVSEEQ